MNIYRAVFPFKILIASDGRNCGLQSTSRWMWSGMTSIAMIFICRSFAVSWRCSFTSSSIPETNCRFLYFVHQTIWYWRDYTYPLPCVTSFGSFNNSFFSIIFIISSVTHNSNKNRLTHDWSHKCAAVTHQFHIHAADPVLSLNISDWGLTRTVSLYIIILISVSLNLHSV